jgi:hypothetical protein
LENKAAGTGTEVNALKRRALRQQSTQTAASEKGGIKKFHLSWTKSPLDFALADDRAFTD